MQLTACPTCGAPAEVRDRFVLESTDGPVEHLALRCVRGHAHRMPTAMLEFPVRPHEKASRATTTRR
jgi:hypothetical protein